MPDNEELMHEIQNLRSDIVKVQARVESMQETLQAELKPVLRLYSGNGRPSLEARLYHTEKEVQDHGSSARWATRTALAGLVSAVAGLLWMGLRHFYDKH